MIILFTGENDFLWRQKLAEFTHEQNGEIERYDGGEITASDLTDVSSGTTLFSDKRTILVRNLAQNTTLWSEAPRFLERISEETTLLLVEPEVDKRTKTYKWLQTNAKVIESKVWTARDESKVEAWAAEQAKKIGVALNTSQIKRIVSRTGFDAGRLYNGLEKLSLADSVTDEVIDQTIEMTANDSVFELFEASLSGKNDRMRQLVQSLSLEADAYQVVGVLASQSLQLMALTLGDGLGKTASEVAAETGFHPFGLSKLSRYARVLGPQKARQIVKDVADADARIKTTSGDPWASVEVLLYRIAAISS